MTAVENRINKLEEEQLGELGEQSEREVELFTVNVCYEETFFNASGEKCERTLPATYDENAPYGKPFYHTELKRWMRCRVRYPLEETADHGILHDDPVTR
jgi:hypothetical protein